MARMRFPQTVPAGGFFYIQQETKLRINGESLIDLSKRVAAHRKYKGLPRATVEEASLDVERQTCSRMGERECVSEGGIDDWKPVETKTLPKLSEILSFSNAAFEWLRSGREMVSVEEADRRGEICNTCPLNQPLVGCRCKPIYKTIALAVPPERRKEYLGICTACGCDLKSKVNLPANVILASLKGRDIKFPAHCWQLALQKEAAPSSDL